MTFSGVDSRRRGLQGEGSRVGNGTQLPQWRKVLVGGGASQKSALDQMRRWKGSGGVHVDV